MRGLTATKVRMMTALNRLPSSLDRLINGIPALALAATLAFAAGYAPAESEKPLTYVDGF